MCSQLWSSRALATASRSELLRGLCARTVSDVPVPRSDVVIEDCGELKEE